MELAIGLILLGLVVGVGCFAYAANNMKNTVLGDTGLEGGLKGHVTAMIGSAIGGVTTLFGLILLLVELVS